MTDWSAALEEPRFYRWLRGLDHRFTDELKAGLDCCGAGEEIFKARKGKEDKDVK